jgi:hypothetical protein
MPFGQMLFGQELWNGKGRKDESLSQKMKSGTSIRISNEVCDKISLFNNTKIPLRRDHDKVHMKIFTTVHGFYHHAPLCQITCV